MIDRRRLGLDIPIRRGTRGYFKSNTRSLDQVRANLKNLLLTRRGERIMKPSFGTRLYEILFEQATPQIRDRIQSEIQRATERFMPYVTIRSTEIEEIPEFYAVKIEIVFTTEFSPFNEEANLELWLQQETI